jgi:CHAT domain-containing protein/tetratricopeptide (TPR) repeat protein
MSHSIRKVINMALVAVTIWVLICLEAPRNCEAAEAAEVPSLDMVRAWNHSGRSAEAEQGARAILAEIERSTVIDSLAMAETLGELAVALRRGGKAGQPESEEVCRRAVSIMERTVGPRDVRYAASLYQFGMLWFSRKEFGRALPLLEQSREIRLDARGSDHNDVALSLLAIGAAQLELGRASIAAATIEQAVSIQAKSLGPDDPDRLRGLNALGSVLYRLGRFSKSILVYEECIRILDGAPQANPPLLGEALHNLGCLQSETGNSKDGEATLRRALSVRSASLGADHVLVASTRVALGEVLYDQGDYVSAKKQYTAALEIQRQAEAAPSERGWTLMKLGWASLVVGERRTARAAFVEAESLQVTQWGPDHPSLWLTLIGRAEADAMEKRTRSAREYFERAIRNLEQAYGPYYLDLGPTRERYAHFLLETGDSAAALDCSLIGADVNRQQLRLAARGLAERQALAYSATLRAQPDVAIAVLAGPEFRSNPRAVERVWDSLLRSRALVLDEIASRHHEILELHRDDPAFERLRRSREELASLLVRGASHGDDYRTQLDRVRAEVDHAERMVAAISPSFREEAARTLVGWPEILAAIPSGSALVSFVKYGTGRERSYLALVLGSDRTVSAHPLGSADRLEERVQQWRRSILQTRDVAVSRNVRAPYWEAGMRVREILWDPIASRIRGADRVFLVPEGSLHLVNFAALPSGPSSFQIEKGPVLHLLSAERELVTLPRRSPGSGMLAIGGPAFQSTMPLAKTGSGGVSRGSTDCQDFSSFEFEPLPASEREIHDLAALWGSRSTSVVLTGKEATEGALKRLSPGKEIVHIASHGFFLRNGCGYEAPGTRDRGIGGVVRKPPRARPQVGNNKVGDNPLLLSGVALAGANGRNQATSGDDDGILTAEEIASLDLSRVSWVVLSACDTGLGEIQSGEGVLGLRRAFQIAGAGTLVMSLWSVEDHATREWMGALYRNRLQHHMPASTAVWEASRSVLRDRRAHGHSTHPFYWAGFVAAGDWN